jgi:arginyl-tRNA synthetase
MLTKKLKRNPREIAEEIISHLDLNPNIIEKTEIAGPGFINFHFKAEYITQIVKEIFDKGENFGKNEIFKGKRALVEFVSANPTGPLTVGHGRNAVVGDTVARLLEWVGYEVTREYYFNNAGRQMRVLGDSVRIRYLQLLGHQVEFPEDYYQGNYIKEIANKLFEEYGASLTDEPAEGIFKQRAEKEIFNDIKNTLKRLGIEFDNFYNEHSLYESGKIDAVIKEFQKRNLTYEKDGALWLKLTELGNEADKVIIKSSGEPTYRLPDIAYHLTKFERGYDLIIDLFGSDHAATYPDVLAAVKALGKDISKVKVLIHQFVTIMQGEQVVKMSTRKANYITLDYLIDEVGADVVRYFFIMRNINSHLNFDIELAKKQSDENPVFYLQYAHARICSIIRTVEREGIKESTENLALLTTEPEQNLLKKLWLFEEEISNAAVNFEPHKVTGYLEELATAFHKFYTECRILGSPKELASARLSLAIATKQIIRTGLSLLGVSAPEKM